MNRYWASWWTGYYADEGCTKPPFQVWNSGERERGTQLRFVPTSAASAVNPDPQTQSEEEKEVDYRDEMSLCAVIDANTPDEIWQVVKAHFPDFEVRFCRLVETDWIPPSDRFLGFANQTLLNPQYHGDSQ